MSDNQRIFSRWAVGLTISSGLLVCGWFGGMMNERGAVMADIVNMKENIQSIEQDNADQEKTLAKVQIDLAKLAANTEWIRRTLERHYGE